MRCEAERPLGTLRFSQAFRQGLAHPTELASEAEALLWWHARGIPSDSPRQNLSTGAEEKA